MNRRGGRSRTKVSMELETEAHTLGDRAEKGKKMGPGNFKHSPQNMEEVW